MAQIQLPPPDRFNFRNPDDWPRWRRRFQQFHKASGLSDESAAKQISTLLYCLGEEAESVLASTNATGEDHADFDRTIGKFDDYFKVRKNIIYERARFNRRNQQSGETAEHYIVGLYKLAEHCDYSDMTEELIRDRLVVGIRDRALSEKLQIDSGLTLEAAKKAIRQREAVHEQQQTLNGSSKVNTDVNAVGSQCKASPKNRPAGQQRHGNRQRTTSQKCGRSGRERHPRDKCPARDAECYHCGGKGHYGAMCRKKDLSSIRGDEDDDESAFLETVTNSGMNAWIAHISIHQRN